MRKKKTPSLVTLAVLTTITVFAWIFFDVYRTISKPSPINVPADILQPFTPNLDKAALDKIKNSKYLSADDLAKIFAATTSAIPENIHADLFAPPNEIQISTGSGQ